MNSEDKPAIRWRMWLLTVAVVGVAGAAALYLNGAGASDNDPLPVGNEALVQVGDANAGFGGIFVDREDNGIVYVYLTDPSHNSKAEAAARAWFGADYDREVSEVRVLQADFTIGQLADWYRQLRDPVWALDGVYTSDLSEGDNRLSYGVRDEATIRAVERVLDDEGVPREAVIFEIMPEPMLR